jgi:hypothetical protein
MMVKFAELGHYGFPRKRARKYSLLGGWQLRLRTMSASVRMTIELNIMHYRKLLESETDGSKRRMTSHSDFDDGAPIFANLMWSHGRRYNNGPPKLVKMPHPGVSGRGVFVRS